MAKEEKNPSKNGHKDEVAGQSEPPPPPPLTKAELQTLFKKYDEANAIVTKARDALERATAQRNTVVAEIAMKAGKGPFRHNGQVLTATKRDDTWFFRSPQTANIQEV